MTQMNVFLTSDKNIPNFHYNLRSKQFLSETVSDVDHVDDLALLSNTPTQAASYTHSLKQATRGIGHYINSDKTEL